ncbi:MAG: AAA family ATPase [Gammaproteobacteria bacterium]|nr:AAA family ATPase [Gammaproteobacteria bacterium]
MERSLEQPVVDPTYLEFFGLTQSPFAHLPDPRQLFHSEQYSLLTEHLANAATNTDSLVVIFGADGSGKSTLINRFVTSIGDQISCVVVDENCHGEEQFYNAFLTQIGFEEISGTASELRNITKEFLVCRGIANDHVLIIIDNAHLADPRILEQLRWLCEIKIKDRRVLSVVLVGNADIVRVIDAPAMRQTKFRSDVVFGIRNYSEEETANYVWHRLRIAGCSNAVKLPNEASSLIHRYSGGIPHLINRLCDDMLVEAHSLESRVITEKIVRIVADKQQLLPHVVPLHGKGRRKSDPDFKHVRVVPKTAGVDSDNLLQQIARLSEQLGDLRADKARALQDIDVRNSDIIALRDQITQQNLALSNSAAALEDSENRSEKLASGLEKETRAREAAQKELARTKATVEELNQLNQELQATADDVQADLKVAGERAVEIEALEKHAAGLKDELEGKTRELDSLRDELVSRNEALADLETLFEKSQAEHESAQQRIAALKHPKELEEIEKASDKLAADLRKEKRARKAAEKELAKATATVEELDQLKQELQARVDGVQADLEAGLKVADERAVEIEALEKNTADLKNELDGKTGELDSLRDELALRNEILADLEMRLDRSQSACELAQLRIVALKSPQELAEIERASDKLASDLEKETRAREAAEKELAKATDLKVEIEGKTGELDALRDELKSLRDELASRNEAVADLETRLGESQAECESAQQRITALRDPEELAEIERASDKLAADLRKEKRARKAADDELANTKATVEELHRLKQELQAKVDDVQADLKLANERAVEIEALEKHTVNLNDEIEGKTGELDSLRDELKTLRDRLASRDKDVADLENWLQESQKERASAQLRINALKDPEELAEIERASDKLAADLRKEKRAREAVEKELAKATAAVEELGQLKRELQATVHDLNADLKVVGERAVEVHVLERNVTGLKEELDKKTRDLDSRNQTLADLEKQLEASQNECELLRRRTPAVNTGEEIVAKQAIPASGRDARVYSSHVVAKFDQSLSSIPAYQTLRQYDPAFYDGLIVTYKQLVGLDFTDKQVNDALRAKQAKLMERLLPGASDEAIIAYARLIVDQLDELRLDGTEPCLSLLIPQCSPDNTSPVYSEVTKGRELDTLDVTLRTYDADRRLPAEKEVWPDLGPIFEELFDEFGADNVAAMENSFNPGVDRGLVCNVTRALYSGILDLPKRKAANALRWLLST